MEGLGVHWDLCHPNSALRGCSVDGSVVVAECVAVEAGTVVVGTVVAVEVAAAVAVVAGLPAAAVVAAAVALVVDVSLPVRIVLVLGLVAASAPASVELLLLLPPKTGETAGADILYPPGVAVLVSARLGVSLHQNLLASSKSCLPFLLA